MSAFYTIISGNDPAALQCAWAPSRRSLLPGGIITMQNKQCVVAQQLKTALSMDGNGNGSSAERQFSVKCRLNFIPITARASLSIVSALVE